MKTKAFFLAILVIASIGLASCRKTSETETLLTADTWFEDLGGGNSFLWTFEPNGDLTMYTGLEMATGTWTYTEKTNTLVRIYSFGNGDIDRHDHIYSIDENTMILESIDFSGEKTTFRHSSSPAPTPHEGPSVLYGTKWYSSESNWLWGDYSRGELYEETNKLRFSREGDSDIVRWKNTNGVTYYENYEPVDWNFNDNDEWTGTFTYQDGKGKFFDREFTLSDNVLVWDGHSYHKTY